MNMDKFAEQTVQWFWLEEMPLAELPNSDVQDIVTAYRCGTLWSEEALIKLKEQCSEEISSWILTNQELSSIFSGEEGEEEV
jgi:hypothetical protein